MDFNNEHDWTQVTAEEIEQAVNGLISAGELVKTRAKKTILNRMLHALDTACKVNQANPLITRIIYNLHREMDGHPPVPTIGDQQVQVFNIFVPQGDGGGVANELYIVESGRIVRIAELNIADDLFASRLKVYFEELSRDPRAEL